MITLYSTGCPQCSVLKKKLEAKGIKYTENNDEQQMLSMNFIVVRRSGQMDKRTVTPSAK